MAEEEGKTVGEKAEAKAKQWLEVTRNKIIKWPLIRYFKFRRREPPESPHPLYLEIEKGWLDMNDTIYKSRLEAVENRWMGQTNQLGSMDTEVESGQVKFGDPKSIVSIYYDMGVYSDYNRISIEHNWFEHGTGLITHKIPCTIPPDKEELKDIGWDEQRVKDALSRNRNKPWELLTIKELELLPGIVFHEDNSELKEILYVFSKAGLEKLGREIDAHNKQFNLEELQEKLLPVEVRTKFSDLSRAIQELLGGTKETLGIKQLEEENLELLKDLSGKKGIYDEKRKTLLENLAPEAIKEFNIRFPHTYKVIKQAVMKEITEEIEGKESTKRLVFKYLDFKNIYKEEMRQLEEDIEKEVKKRELMIKEKERIIDSLTKLKDDKNLFKTEVESMINKNKGVLKSILDELKKNSQTKFEEIIQLLKHTDDAMNNLLKEIVEVIKAEIYDIIKSTETSNNKIVEIQNLIINSIKRSAIIEAHIKRKEEAIKGSLYPIGIEEERDTERIKSRDEMYDALIYSFSIGYPEVDNLIESIFVEYKQEIEELIEGLIKQGKQADTEKAYQTIAELVVRESKKNDNEIGLIQIHLVKIENEKKEIIKEKGEETYEARMRDINNLKNKEEILKELKREEDTFDKRKEEVALGLDEYGHPLEVDKDGYVLIDKWWAEISQNPWQIRTIAMKPGGDQVLKNHLGVDVTYYEGKPQHDDLGIDEEDEPEKKKWRPFIKGKPRRVTKIKLPNGTVKEVEVRKVNDPDLIGYIDLLDISTMIFGYWDSVRDDIRDGRYHRHSKSVGDYVIESMGGYDENRGAPYFKAVTPDPSILRKWGLYFGRRGVDPTSVFNLKDPGYIKATPFYFENTKKHPNRIPNDEDMIKREFKLRLPDGVTTPDGSNFYTGIRKSTKYYPAFDRRARGLPFIFWGNMYYWRWAGYAFEWSENPYSHISSRGIALYLKHLAESDAYYFNEAEKILEGHQYDYGTRGQGMFPWNNPSSGKDVVGEKAEN